MTESAPATGSESTTSGQVKEQVREKAQVAQDKAKGAADQARGRLREQVDQRSTQAGERVSATAGDVRSVAEELRRQGKDTPARLIEQAAGQADRLSDYLKAASGERILGDVEDFARSKPWLVAAGGLTLGFAASRFLKASSSRRYQASSVDDTVGTGYDRSYPATDSVVASDVPVVGVYDPEPTSTSHAPVERYGPTDPERLS
jgi:hypothetical protein